jgi:hypothetical protein
VHPSSFKVFNTEIGREILGVKFFIGENDSRAYFLS